MRERADAINPVGTATTLSPVSKTNFTENSILFYFREFVSRVCAGTEDLSRLRAMIFRQLGKENLTLFHFNACLTRFI